MNQSGQKGDFEMMKNLIEWDGRNAFLFRVIRILMLRYIYIQLCLICSYQNFSYKQTLNKHLKQSWCSNKTLMVKSIKSLELWKRNESSVKVPHMLTCSKPGQACQQGLFWVRVGVERAELVLMSFNEGAHFRDGLYRVVLWVDLVLFQTRLVGCRGALPVFRASCAAV